MRPLRAIEPNLAITENGRMQETAAESVASTRLALWLLGVFAVVAVTLCKLGAVPVRDNHPSAAYNKTPHPSHTSVLPVATIVLWR